MLYAGRLAGSAFGLVIGAELGFLAAQLFPLWGGWLMMGEPYSPHRYQLVPGHVAVFAALFGVVGFGAGWLLDRVGRPPQWGAALLCASLAMVVALLTVAGVQTRRTGEERQRRLAEERERLLQDLHRGFEDPRHR